MLHIKIFVHHELSSYWTDATLVWCKWSLLFNYPGNDWFNRKHIKFPHFIKFVQIFHLGFTYKFRTRSIDELKYVKPNVFWTHKRTIYFDVIMWVSLPHKKFYWRKLGLCSLFSVLDLINNFFQMYWHLQIIECVLDNVPYSIKTAGNSSKPKLYQNWKRNISRSQVHS